MMMITEYAPAAHMISTMTIYQNYPHNSNNELKKQSNICQVYKLSLDDRVQPFPTNSLTKSLLETISSLF